MLFNSLPFLAFLPLTFLVYWFAFKGDRKAQNVWILIASYFFYGWWDYRFLTLIFISSIVDYSLGNRIHKSTDNQKRKLLLWLSIAVNLGILITFKYFNFFIESFSFLLQQIGLEPHPYSLQIILPVGVSFYTFQTLSYTIDIYRKRLEPTRDIIAFFSFVSFFPQLVAGPIERAKHLLPQFLNKRKFEYSVAISGAKLMIYGMFKKVVIADQLAPIVDQVYSSPEAFTPLIHLFVTFLFALQIYCDFSGYSDIAIGTARLFGFDLMTNFHFPYFSNSFNQFWQRWHISLSTWFRDYVYIPLGGNRGSQMRTTSNTMITFLVSGLWHGANITFVVWGGLHGLYLIIERKTKDLIKMPKLLSGLVVFLFVTIAWMFFRAETLIDAMVILKGIPNLSLGGIALQFRGLGIQTSELYSYAFLFGVFMTSEVYHSLKTDIKVNNKWLSWLYYQGLILLLAFYGFQNEAQNFIYFQF